jgi:hypothetical protein
MVLAQLARVVVDRGDLDTARRHSRETIGLALTTEDMPLLAGIVEMARPARPDPRRRDGRSTQTLRTVNGRRSVRCQQAR